MRIPLSLFGAAMLAATAAPAQICPGDCDRDRRVTVDEIVTGISFALGTHEGADCPAFDRNFDRMVDVAEIMAAVVRVLEGCSLQSLEELERRRRESLERWRGAGIDSYEIDYQRLCFCLPPSEVVVLVRQGEIVSVRDAESGEEIDNPFEGNPFAFNSVDGVFSIIADAIEERAAMLDVDYHPDLGYPERVSIDYVDEIADDEIAIRITALRPLRTSSVGR